MGLGITHLVFMDKFKNRFFLFISCFIAGIAKRSKALGSRSSLFRKETLERKSLNNLLER
jgi:hypothetical protein